MTGTEVIPATAWQQAAIIGIFIVFVGIVFGFFSKSEKERQQYQTDLTKQNQDFQRAESDKWQKHMAEENDKWRVFSKQQREENNSCMADVNKGLTNLTQVTQGLVSEVREMREESRQISADLQDHDLQAKEILTHVQNNGKTVAKPRARVNGEGAK